MIVYQPGTKLEELHMQRHRLSELVAAVREKEAQGWECVKPIQKKMIGDEDGFVMYHKWEVVMRRKENSN